MVRSPQLHDWLSGLVHLTLRHTVSGHCSLVAAMLPRLTALQSLTLADDANAGLVGAGGEA
jgi:hypothetical protein